MTWARWFLGNVAAFLGEAEEAERLCRECAAMWASAEPPYRAAGLWLLGETHIVRGRYREADAALRESAALYRDTEGRDVLGRMLPTLCEGQMHLGFYEQAWQLAQEAATLNRENGSLGNEVRALAVLVGVALVEGRDRGAANLLTQAAMSSRVPPTSSGEVLALAGHPARRLGQVAEARQHLASALQMGLKVRSLRPLWAALPVIALLWADRGR